MRIPSSLNLFKSKSIFYTCTFCVLAGFEIFQIAGVRIALIPAIIFAFKEIWETKRIPKLLFSILIFCLLSSLSLIHSPQIGRSVAYLIIPIYVFLSSLFFYNYAKKNLNVVLEGVLIGSRLTILFASLLWIIGLHERARAFYFEPSYLVMGTMLYLTVVIAHFLEKKNKFVDVKIDGFICFLLLMSTMSATLLMFVGITLLTLLITRMNFGLFIKSLIVVSILYGAGRFYVENNDDLLSNSLKIIYNSDGNVFLQMLERTGNRYPRLLLALEVASDRFLGVGAGAYEFFTLGYKGKLEIYNLSWLSPYGKPPVNIFLEVIVSNGWLAGLWLIAMFGYMIKKAWVIRNYSFFKIFLVASTVIMLIETNPFRPYFWIPYMIILGAPAKENDSLEAEKKAV